MVIIGRGGKVAISDAFLQELKYRCDIETVVSRYVNLRKSGRGLVGLCPFHSEKTPSFHIFPDNQNFYCFGCESGGDVITFIRKIENLEYIEALKFLAQMAGIAMPVEEGEEGTTFLKGRILEINRQAALYFHKCLMSPQGAKGLEYFQKRRLSPETIKGFGLGYAQDSWDALTRHLTNEGYSLDEIRASSLADVSKKTGNYYDLFRNRVMFPIIDLRGNVIAFGGRVLDDSQPKYLNSRDTLVFNKSRCLFALNFAKNGNNSSMILCEGYMDAIALHQAGFKNAMATLGTALTPEQSRLMARYAKEVIISYDSDTPGQNAAQRAIGLLTAAGLSVRVLHIEGGKDPDEYIKTYGADKFRLMLEKSGNHIEYRLNELKAKYNIDITEQRAEFLKEAAKVLASIESSMECEVYASKLGEELGVSKDSILADVAKLSTKHNRSAINARNRAELSASRGLQDKLNPEKSKYLLASIAEENLIVLLYNNPDFFKKADEIVKSSDFLTSLNRKLFEAVTDEIKTCGEANISHLGEIFSPEEMGRITSLLMTRKLSNTIEEVKDCCETILQEKTESTANVDNTIDVLKEIRKKKLEDKRKFEGSN
jgi:DNA primase